MYHLIKLVDIGGEILNTLISTIRANRNMTQAELAKKLNIQQTAVSMWETGKSLPRTELLPKIAEILNCKIDDLFSN